MLKEKQKRSRKKQETNNTMVGYCFSFSFTLLSSGVYKANLWWQTSEFQKLGKENISAGTNGTKKNVPNKISIKTLSTLQRKRIIVTARIHKNDIATDSNVYYLIS